jgi:hypothetical protein
VGHRARDRGWQHADVVGLGDEVEDTGVHRLEHRGDGPFLAEDDHWQNGIHGVDATEDLDSVHVRHVEIRDHEIQLGRRCQLQRASPLCAVRTVQPMSSRNAETASKLMKESSISKTLPGGLAVSWVERRNASRLRGTGRGAGRHRARSSLGVDPRSLTRCCLTNRAEIRKPRDS